MDRGVLPVSFTDVEKAARRIADHVKRTPVLRSDWIDEVLEAEVFVKAEHLQEAGAFKSRGACNAVFSLSDKDAQRGVVTHSSGNHAAALARAAQRRGIAAHIVMPENAPELKVKGVRIFGGNITFCRPTLEDRETVAARVQHETGATFVHPYDNNQIIAGQGTAALEFLMDYPDLDILVAPVGGGGLLGGTLISANALQPQRAVWAAEPAGADDAYRSWKADRRIPQENPQTIADGLRTSVGERNFAIMQALVKRVLLAQENTIRETVAELHRRHSWTVEPSGVVPLAALRDEPGCVRGKRVGLIFSGGNVDLAAFLDGAN